MEKECKYSYIGKGLATVGIWVGASLMAFACPAVAGAIAVIALVATWIVW